MSRLNHPNGSPTRPSVVVNMAASLDGKATTGSPAGVFFSSRQDKRRLLEIRAEADAVLIGANTLRLDDPPLHIPHADLRKARLAGGLPQVPLRGVVTASGRISPAAKIFARQEPRALVFTTERIPGDLRHSLERIADVYIAGETRIAVRRVLAILKENYGVSRLLLEGGGELNFSFLREGLVDEIYLTLCPMILGGREVPTVVGGEGFSPDNAVSAELISSAQRGSELFLHYRVFPQEPSSQTNVE